MKIICLQAENVKRLKAVTIRPDGNLVLITGRNGQGKTSVLDAIYWALAGANNAQPMPIRKGAGRARIRLNLGEILVQRTFSRRVKDDATTTSLIVETVDGARYPSPQAMLDDLIGELSFDPLGFSRAPVKDQVDMLKRLVPGVDFDAIAEANAADYAERTDVNRLAKRALGAAESMKPPRVPEDMVERDENEYVLELERAGEFNAELEREKSKRERASMQIHRLREKSSELYDRAEKLRAEADRLVEESATLETDADNLETELEENDPLEDPIETAAIREKLEMARAHNKLVAQERRFRGFVDEHQKHQTRSAELTQAIAERNAQKRAAIAAANLPVPGLAFDEDHVEMSGVPFEQASDAEQLRASCAIAAALNPKLRVIRIRDGSLLDPDGLRLLGEFADANDMQVWVERVDTSNKVGFVIEDGTIAEPDESSTTQE